LLSLFAAAKRVAYAAFSQESRMKFVHVSQPYGKFGAWLFPRKNPHLTELDRAARK
jgi:hypothetical protein